MKTIILTEKEQWLIKYIVEQVFEEVISFGGQPPKADIFSPSFRLNIVDQIDVQILNRKMRAGFSGLQTAIKSKKGNEGKSNGKKRNRTQEMHHPGISG